TSTNKYKVSSISYDQIGNITAFQRYGSAGTLMDNMTYAYHQGTNRLRSVSDAVASSLYASDLNNQRGNNYQYDGAGNMAEDFESGVAFTRYNTANLPTQMEKFKNPSGMVAWFTLDSTARDESNNANHATPMSVTYDSSGVRGLYGLKMNGTTTGYMYAADHSAYHVSQPSLEAWVKPASISTSQTIACMSISGAWSDGRGFYMDVTSAGYPRFIVGNASGSWKIVTSTVALSVGQWSHVAGTYDGANLRIFVNGVQAGIANIGSVTISYTPRANSGPNPSVFYVGIQHNANNTAPTYAPDLAGPFNGVIDEVKVYNRALTGPEILSLYHKNTRSIVYRYEHTGNRIMKQDADGLTTYYVLDAAGRTLAVVENSSVKTYNVNGLDQIGYVRPAVGWERYYHLKDHLGSIRVTLADDGTPRAWDDYYPFGMVMEGKSGVSGSPDTRYKFTGKEQDTETGYDYFGARYYDARIGRWLAADPLADMYPAASAYQYALNDPIVHIDPDGRKVRNRHHA
ncbi:MAG: hypothetical protein IH628_00165, partial [Proteobacteria bacterium]|nr:hypothetical protein [Pseudomonadota bacterium]